MWTLQMAPSAPFSGLLRLADPFLLTQPCPHNLKKKKKKKESMLTDQMWSSPSPAFSGHSKVTSVDISDAPAPPGWLPMG